MEGGIFLNILNLVQLNDGLRNGRRLLPVPEENRQSPIRWFQFDVVVSDTHKVDRGSHDEGVALFHFFLKKST